MTQLDDGQRCPCGAGLAYGECFAPIHRGGREAASAEQLMRARFIARRSRSPVSR